MMRINSWKSSTSFCSVAAGLAALLIVGCGAGKIPPVKTYEQAKKEVQAKGDLVSPPIEEREGYPEGKGQKLNPGEAAPFKGLLIDRDKSARLAAIKAERDRRRKELQAEREKAEIQKKINESLVVHLKAKLEARSTWWERNKGLVGFTIGTVLCMAIVTSILYALTKGQGAATTTNTHILQAVPER